MTWSGWLFGLALFGAAAAALLAVLARGPGARALARIAAAVAAWSPRRALVVVLVATAATRAAALPLFEPPYETDVKEYVEKAEVIADDGTPRRQEVKPDGRVFYRPLGSSLALAGWYRLTGTRGLLSARIHGIALACAAAWLILVLGRTIGRETDARIAALGYAVLLSHAVFATIPYTETFATVLVLGISIFFERLRRDLGGWPSASALGLLGGWLAITRTELVLLPLLALALLAWERRREWMEAIAPCVLAGLLLIVPLAVNHELRAGYPGRLRTSCQGGLILYFGNNPIEVNGYGNATPAVQAAMESMRALDPSGALAGDAALDWMAAHPLEVVLNAPKKAFHLWLAEPQGFRWHAAAGRPPSWMERTTAAVLRGAAYVQSLMLLAAGLAGLRLLGAERRFWTWALVLHLGVWCLLAASARNRYALEPWLLLAAAAALTARRAAAGDRSAPGSGAAATGSAGAATP